MLTRSRNEAEGIVIMRESDQQGTAGAFARIVTHDDFDGVVSAALCSLAEGIDDFRFAGPGNILDGGLEVSSDTIVCDLPHHPAAGLWFDHHAGNFEDYCLKGGEPEAVRDTFVEEKSCARVVYRYYRDRGFMFPGFMDMTVEETDTIDSFDYEGLEDWQRQTPGKTLSDTLRIFFRSKGEKNRYMRHLIRRIRESPLEEVVTDAEVQEKAGLYRVAEEKSRALIERLASFRPEDEEQEVVLLDTTGLKHAPYIIKSLAFLSYPRAVAVLEVKSLFRQNRKTNDLAFSMSLSPSLELASSEKDVGEIMRSLNMGDGHRGAGAGRIHARSKAEMMKQKEQVLQKIMGMWRNQRTAGVDPPTEGDSG
jgi:oligoribonuclease NrnB/cAMP/cGMP phosphodiesterase (DHH superfamily)